MKSKKRLGQNFLSNRKILEQIVEAGEISSADTVLEVGPGKGSLTEILSQKAKKVIAVEKDHGLVIWLMEHKTWKNVEIVEGDILKNTNRYTLNAKRFKVVANIPYYITSHFLKTFLTAPQKPQLMVLMVQYEVAKRILAKPGEMNLLALSVQIYGTPRLVSKVSKNYFHPRPKVDSAIIKISDISDKWLRDNGLLEEKLFALLKKAFGQKRKMLLNSLGVDNLPEKYKNDRPENLSLEDWVSISKLFL